MAYDDMILALETDFNTAFDATYPVQTQNMARGTFSKPDNAIWIRLHLETGEAQTIASGSSVEYREILIMTAQVFAPIGSGTAAILAIEDLMKTRYAYVDFVVGDAENTIVAFMGPKVSRSERDESPGQYQVNISMTAEVDFSK